MQVSVSVSERTCVCDNFNVEKRARNYRKKHLSRGKIIKSIHTHKTSWKTLNTQLDSSQCGTPRKTRGDKKSIPVCFSGSPRQWENRWRKSARAGKIENFQQRPTEQQFASDLASEHADIFRFSDTFPTIVVISGGLQQQVRRLPENSRVEQLKV